MNLFHKAALLLIAGCIGFAGCDGKKTSEEKKPAGTLRICTHGGAFLHSQQIALFKPFESMTSIKVIVDIQETSLYDSLQATVASGHPKWDVIFCPGNIIFRADRDGLLTPLDYTAINRKNLLPWASRPNEVAGFVYSTVLSYCIKQFPNTDDRPTSWKDFFDIQRIPGPRALQEGPVGNLEIALLADGVAPDTLYPLDVDRAFRKLDTIKPYLNYWWKKGSEPPQWLFGGKVVLTSAYNGRIWAAQKRGACLRVVWNQGLLNSGWWAIPRGISEERKQRAMNFIAFASRAEPQANLCRIIAYGPTNIYAMRRVAEQIQSDLPTEKSNLKQQVRVNIDWWQQHHSAILKRWNEWKGN